VRYLLYPETTVFYTLPDKFADIEISPLDPTQTKDPTLDSPK